LSINFSQAKNLLTYISKEDIIILRLHNLSAKENKVKFTIFFKNKALYESDWFVINANENAYYSLNELVRNELEENKEGILIKISLDSQDKENLESQLITMSPEAGVLISSEPKKINMPTIKKVSPQKISVEGGTLITIIGSGFDESAIVRIDGIETLRLRESENKIIAIAPPHDEGKASVEVENPGQKSYTLADALEYLMPAPLIYSISPDSSTQTGSITAEITGNNFTEKSKVFFGSISAEVKYINKSKLQVIVPPQKNDVVDLKVVNPDGAEAILKNAFRYYGNPVIISISPNTGPPEGKTLITISGDNFDKDSIVLFDGYAGQINYSSKEIISVYSPPHPSGYASIEVKNPNGLSAILTNGFLYNSPPKIKETYAYPNPCLKRTRIRLEVSAIDPENESLTYLWSIAGGVGGNIIGNGPQVFFECPNVSGETYVDVVVSDVWNASVRTSIVINTE